MQSNCVKTPKQNRLRSVLWLRVGVDIAGYDVPKNTVFMRVFGHHPNYRTVFATLLQHVMNKKHFATEEVVADGFAVN